MSWEAFFRSSRTIRGEAGFRDQRQGKGALHAERPFVFQRRWLRARGRELLPASQGGDHRTVGGSQAFIKINVVAHGRKTGARGCQADRSGTCV